MELAKCNRKYMYLHSLCTSGWDELFNTKGMYLYMVLLTVLHQETQIWVDIPTIWVQETENKTQTKLKTNMS